MKAATRQPTWFRQRGFSPVELLIGMAIALLLVASLVQMLAANRSSTRSEADLARIQEAGRFATEFLGREVRKAGYQRDTFRPATAVFPAGNGFQSGAAVTGTDSTVAIRFQGSGDSWSTNCLGAEVAANLVTTQTLSQSGGGLRCATQNTPGGSLQTQALLPNIEALRFRYGVDDDGDGYADRYLAAAAVSAWASVVSVKAQVRVVSSSNGATESPQAYRDFTNAVVTPSDTKMRRTYATVIALRNRIP